VHPTIDFHQIDETGQPIEVDTGLELRVDDLGHDDIEAVSGVHISLTASKGSQPGEYVVEGRFRFMADVLCSRCLEPVPFASESEFAVRFRPHPSVDTPEFEIEIEEGDLEVEHYTEPTLSLERLAAEQLELALPMKLVCDEACLGLCPVCGTNLRTKPCDCGKNDVDERWQALASLRNELSKKQH
jgi:uncharacterized protein